MNHVSERAPLKVAGQSLLCGPRALPTPLPTNDRVAIASPAADKHFSISQRTYTQQYANVYFVRLQELKPVATRTAHHTWLSDSPALSTKPLRYAPKVMNIVAGEPYFVVGTVYCEQKFRPNVLDDLSKELWVAAPPPRTTYASDHDAVYLEDESSRVSLVGEILRQTPLVTGIVIGVRGVENLNGEFEVSEVCFPGLAPQPPLPECDREDKYVALISGLGVSTQHSVPLGLELFKEFVVGQLGGDGDQTLAARVVKVIVAGDLIGSEEINEQLDKVALTDTGALQQVDTFLEDLASSVTVDVMPGPNDPANHAMPQQPLHTSLFPQTAQLSTFTSHTNPAWFDIDGVRLLGTGGQAVDDACKYTPNTDPLTMAELMLRWQHIAPSAPDTLWCYPFAQRDPFIIRQTPHLFFIGNQAQYASKLVKGAEGQVCRIVCVPRFDTSQTVVLVNLRTLAVHPVGFRCTL
ncbi:DNA polymerase delta small subunit Cdc1 [Dispira parvispora]|uniref:DNA-directed DNA polymerase n=1 Tax=Dispira parvispora TaxID=1520584 RepID=A0A9W8AMQ1_9FUNG|nr:DNA polymerase delta small subunit Cdc1 [Dispira parvispora]